MVTNFWRDTKNMHFSSFTSILIGHSTPPQQKFHHMIYKASFSCVFQCQNVISFLGSMLPQYMALCVSLFVKKKIYATSKQGRRLGFGMLTALTSIRSSKVLHHASCLMPHASCIMHHALQVGSRDLVMLTALTNIR